MEHRAGSSNHLEWPEMAFVWRCATAGEHTDCDATGRYGRGNRAVHWARQSIWHVRVIDTNCRAVDLHCNFERHRLVINATVIHLASPHVAPVRNLFKVASNNCLAMIKHPLN